MKLRLFSVPHISGPISGVPVEVYRERNEHIKELDLADTSQGEPETLIGSDYYSKLATGERIHGNGGPVAVYTELGWILSNPVFSYNQHCTNLITRNESRLRSNIEASR
uniref:Uncharacterized protein n=1 Tax=Amphimedon queenslandica TaxID=400682 RepID=A0A1X7TX60_AMPQE